MLTYANLTRHIKIEVRNESDVFKSQFRNEGNDK